MSDRNRKKSASSRVKAHQASTQAPDLSLVAAAVNEQIAKDAGTAGTKPKRKGPPASRQNKKGLVLYVDPAVTVALRRLALDTGKSVQELGMEALNGLFRRHDLPEFTIDNKKSG